VLRIGILLPQAADPATNDSFGPSIGLAGIAAADSAVNIVNANGGFRGQDVVLYKADEGSTADRARAGIAELLDDDVDAIVGPASSSIAIDTLGQLMSAGVLTCSPTANSLLLDDFPDRALFFRLIASDSTAAIALADRVRQSGVSSTTLVYVDDAFGRPFAEATASALRSRRVTIAADVPFSPDDADLSDEANAILEAGASSIVLIADAAHGWPMMTAIGAIADRFSSGTPIAVVVNDAMSRPPSPDVVAALPESLRTTIQGVSPRGLKIYPDEPPGPFATNTFDCVNLIALAALQADSDDPQEMAAQIVDISRDGAACTGFDTCKERIDRGLDIDYNGPSQFLTLGDDGDPARGAFRTFVFDGSGVAVDNGPITITA
jgi:branched-chain amino acid transport system substrate-binding protein